MLNIRSSGAINTQSFKIVFNKDIILVPFKNSKCDMTDSKIFQIQPCEIAIKKIRNVGKNSYYRVLGAVYNKSNKGEKS